MKRSPLRRISQKQRDRTARLVELKQALLAERERCERCGRHWRDCDRMDLHHLQNRSQGGSDAPENLALLCRRCHDQITAHTCEDWARWTRTRKHTEPRHGDADHVQGTG